MSKTSFFRKKSTRSSQKQNRILKTTGAPKKFEAPVSIGEVCRLSIHSMGNSGEGVGRFENFTIFVPFALPGEEIECEITILKKNYAVGKLLAVVRASSERCQPSCPLYGSCGGCQLQHATYEEQLRLKQEKVKDIVERIGKMDPSIVLPTLGPKDPWAYRNKMQMPVGGSQDSLKMGFYAAGSHDIIQGTSCAIQKSANNDIAQVCYDIARELQIEPYNEKTGSGILRHVIGRIGQDQWMVILVTATKTLPKADQWVTFIRERLPQVTSIVQNYNPKRTNVIMGPDNIFLWGQEYIEDSIEDLHFNVSPHSFFQVNPEQTAVLYGKALEFANLKGEETVIDAYCGTGTISLFLAHKAKKVIGIEIVEPAILDARANAKRNGFTNTEFIVGDAAQEMPKLYQQGIRPDVIVFDPIRAGCKEPVLTAAAAMEPKRIVYVSCNPASMARDILFLKDYGYEAVQVQPVDMFPMTAHVECISLLSRKDK